MDKLSLVAIYPELLLLVMACLIALVDIFSTDKRRRATHWFSLATLAVTAVLCAMYGSGTADAPALKITGFANMVTVDPMGSWLKCFTAIAMVFTLVYARDYAHARDMMRGGELYLLALFATLGMFIMIGGNNFLVIYLGLELLTLSSYAMVALRRDHAVSTEAAMKYFVLGALASGFLLYGLSMLYGATGSLDVDAVFKAISSGQLKSQVLVFGIVFIVAGLAFKLGAAPFHMWVPDVYQGAPTAVTLIIGGAPKLAAFAITIRLLVESALPLAKDWQQMLGVLAVASLVVGNFAAIAQTNIKRMLAFSTIAQIGFVLLGLMTGFANGNTLNAQSAYSAAMFYIISYVLTTLAVFGVLMALSREGFESEEIADFAGLNQRSPLHAAIMALCLFSLAGIPPLVGFYAKFAVLQALIGTGSSTLIGLAVFAVLMSLIGAFYYLRVIKVMYFDDLLTALPVTGSADTRAALGINAILIIVLGLMPGGLLDLCRNAIVATLAR
jgi:NADH-quinone oxidoreductase subunit N